MKPFFRSMILLVLLALFASWGFLVHRTVNQLAVYQLPKEMQPYFFKNMDYIVKYSVRPDQRRSEDPAEASRHYINFEIFGDSAAWKMPMEWNKAVEMYSKDTLLKAGYVPYHIAVMRQHLTRAFKNKQADSILFYATDLAHYIGDAHVPLHTSVNYDGQLSNQRGLHALWESVVPELELTSYNLSSRHRARYLSNPDQAVWRALRSGFQLLEEVFKQEREATKLFTDSTKYRIQVRNGREVKYYTSAFAREYARRLGNTINLQLTRSSELIADYWYTCWVDAGRPALNGLLRSQFTDSDKKQCREESKAYRKNELIKKNWLIAKMGTNNAESN